MKFLQIGMCAVLSVAMSLAFATKTYGPIKKGDSLWRIAVKNRPARTVSVHDMVLAIQKMNATALNGTSNLSVGDTLTIPATVAEVRTAITNAQTTSPAKKAAVTEEFVKTNAAPIVNKPVAFNKEVIGQTPAPTARPNATRAVETQVSPLVATQTATSNTGFPWVWLWFVVLLIAGSYVAWSKIAKRSFADGEKGTAAARLGISIRRKAPCVTKYKTRRFQDKQSSDPQFKTMNNTPFSADSADAIAGAMIDMAEDSNENAEAILQAALAKDTQNLEVRMKLLELYVQTNNRTAFKREADTIESMVPEHSAMWNTVRSMYLTKWAYDG